MGFGALDQKAFLRQPCGGQSGCDLERVHLPGPEDVVEALIVAESRLQALVVMPDDQEEEQADQARAESDLLADA